MKEVTYKNKKRFVKGVLRAVFAAYDVGGDIQRVVIDELCATSGMLEKDIRSLLDSRLRRELFIFTLLTRRSIVEECADTLYDIIV